MAGTNLYWGHGEDALRALAEELRHPGVPQRPRARLRARRPRRCSSRARAATALKGADVALVIGVPMDFRLGFGQSFGEETEIVVIDRAEPVREHPRAGRRRAATARSAGILDALRSRRAGGAVDTSAWVAQLRADGDRASARPSRPSCADDRAPLHPMRLYGELGEVLDRNAIVIGDGGDFVSYAGRVIDSYEPGCWLDPGPFGCLGSGPGYALAAKLAHPERQVVLLLGDGAFGFSGMEFDTLARHGVERRRRDGQQRHLGAREAPDGVPLRLLGRGRAAARDALRRGRRGARRPRRAGAHARRSCSPRSSARSRPGKPALVNVLTDPDVVYPRKSNLA